MTDPPAAGGGQVQGGLGDGLADRQDPAAEQWVSYQTEYGDHDWHRPDPMLNPLCRRCGLYTGRDCGDGCPENPVRRRRVVAGPWEPVPDARWDGDGMTTGQQGIAALRISDEEAERLRAFMAEASRRIQAAVAPLRQVAESLVEAAPRVVEGDLPPLAELVTDEDVQDALSRLGDTWTRGPVGGESDLRMRAALEAYGARLLARHGQTPQR